MSRRSLILHDVLALVLAGGQGERLYPLTRDRGKPAVPFGGIYRIIDFTLSNCLNSGLRKIFVLTQYKSGSLERHIKHRLGPDLLGGARRVGVHACRRSFGSGSAGTPGRPTRSTRTSTSWSRRGPGTSFILSGDHIYKMDYRRMLELHEASGAIATVAAVEVPIEQASAFGVHRGGRSPGASSRSRRSHRTRVRSPAAPTAPW